MRAWRQKTCDAFTAQCRLPLLKQCHVLTCVCKLRNYVNNALAQIKDNQKDFSRQNARKCTVYLLYLGVWASDTCLTNILSFIRNVRDAPVRVWCWRQHHGERDGALPDPVPDTAQPHPQHVHHQQRDGRHCDCGTGPRSRGWSPRHRAFPNINKRDEIRQDKAKQLAQIKAGQMMHIYPNLQVYKALLYSDQTLRRTLQMFSCLLSPHIQAQPFYLYIYIFYFFFSKLSSSTVTLFMEF